MDEQVNLKPVKNGWVVYYKNKYHGSVRWKRSSRFWVAYRDGFEVGRSSERDEAVGIVIEERPRGFMHFDPDCTCESCRPKKNVVPELERPVEQPIEPRTAIERIDALVHDDPVKRPTLDDVSLESVGASAVIKLAAKRPTLKKKAPKKAAVKKR